LESLRVSTRLKISALWVSMLFVFLYVAGSVVEVALLMGILYYAWAWPRRSAAPEATE
jgi:hypothetical protein